MTTTVFKTDKIITQAEIETAVAELNRWLLVKYPGYPFRYSSDPDAAMDAGLLALKGSKRVMALLISKFLAQGRRMTGLTEVEDADPDSVTLALDLIRTAAYPEDGRFTTVSKNTLTDVPGFALLNLIEQDVVVAPTPPANAPKPSEGYTQADMDAAVNKALDAVSKAVEGARR